MHYLVAKIKIKIIKNRCVLKLLIRILYFGLAARLRWRGLEGRGRKTGKAGKKKTREII